MIVPTIGRKVWYWPINEYGMRVHSLEQACDATIVYVWGDTSVNLKIVDHQGGEHVRTSAFLHQGEIENKPSSSCATWMPYQAGQAAKAQGAAS